MSSAPERRPVTVRRAPKIIPFLVLGALLGLIGAGIIAFTGPESEQFSRGTVLGFFSALLLIPGLLLGAIVALVLDWISVRRSRNATAESTGADPAAESVDSDAREAAAEADAAEPEGRDEPVDTGPVDAGPVDAERVDPGRGDTKPEDSSPYHAEHDDGGHSR